MTRVSAIRARKVFSLSPGCSYHLLWLSSPGICFSTAADVITRFSHRLHILAAHELAVREASDVHVCASVETGGKKEKEKMKDQERPEE